MEDLQIIELYFQRNESAISETDKKYGKYCIAIANNILNDSEDSKECVNDTWLKAWNSIPPQNPNNLKIFLAKITRNLAFNIYEKRKAKKRIQSETTVILDELEECIGGGFDVESEVNMHELKESINKFIMSLPKKESDLFVRRYFFAESAASVAKRYGMTKNNVTVSLSRIRKKLKKHLEQEDFTV